MKILNRDYKESPLNKKVRYYYDLKKRINDSGMDPNIKYYAMNYCDKEINRCWRNHYNGFRGYEGGPSKTRGAGIKKITVKGYAKTLIREGLDIEDYYISECPFCGKAIKMSLEEESVQVPGQDNPVPVYRFLISGNGFLSPDCTCDFEYRSNYFNNYFSFPIIEDIFRKFIDGWNGRSKYGTRQV